MEKLEERIGYSFHDRRLLENALTHSSYANERHLGYLGCNERLEFLGDALLGMVTAQRLFRTFPQMPEGKMTRLRAELVCEQSLAAVARRLDLGSCLLLGRGEEQTGGRTRPSILADAVEALLAAVYCDGGLDATVRLIDAWVLPDLEKRAAGSLTDYQTELQEVLQRRGAVNIRYRIIGESGPDHDKTFTAQALVEEQPVGTGTGRSKKEAEQAAACAALQTLEKP